MAGRNLPEYKWWEGLVQDNWDYWQYYRNMYSYALQKPARTFFTSWLYPGWYQERLIYKQLYDNMQMVGQVQQEELEQYSEVTGESGISRTFNNFMKGPYRFSALWNPIGLLGAVSMTATAFVVKKPFIWLIAPAAMFYVFTMGIENRLHTLRIGNVVDMTQWVIEKRKAEVWAAEQKGKFSGITAIPNLEAQLMDLVSKAR